MLRRSVVGPFSCALLLTGLIALAPRMAAAQEADTTSIVQPTAAISSAVDPDSGTAQPDTDKPETRKKRDKLRLHWRGASMDYGRKVRLDFRSKFRGEVRGSDAAITKEELDALDIPRHRVGFDGQVMGALKFKVDRELDSTNHLGLPTDPWRDVYFDVTQLQEAQFRYGQFKMPFSLDETTSSEDLDFAYRSTSATLLAPSRARGWMVHGDTLGQLIGYEYGVFRTDGSNSIVHTSEKRVNAGQTTAWRVWSEPLQGLNSPFLNVHIGYAKTFGDLPEGVSGIKGRTVLGADFYKPEFLVFGRRERRGLEFAWMAGPASVKMEQITLTEERKGEGVQNNDLSPYQVKGQYISGSYVFTGERKARGLDRPLHPLLQGGIGAIEGAVRVEKVTFGSVATGLGSSSPRADVLPSNTDRILSFSGNWYPNRWVKIQLTYSREQFTDPSIVYKTLRPTPNFWSRVLRVQFSI
jgi:phosphate-selective porin OprO and OprP